MSLHTISQVQNTLHLIVTGWQRQKPGTPKSIHGRCLNQFFFL